MTDSRLAGELGEGLVGLLGKHGYVPVREEDHQLAEAIREKYEIAASALHALRRSSDINTRVFAEVTLGRISSPDNATPFADLRKRSEELENEVTELRSVLRRLVDIVGQKSFMDAVVLMQNFDDVFALGEQSMLVLALKEARRCLKSER